MSIFFATDVKSARSAHFCDVMCGRAIQPGEPYQRGFGTDGDHRWTWKVCQHCLALVRTGWVDFWDEGWSTDDIVDWEPEGWEQLKAKAGFKRQWRHPHGGLLPIPSSTGSNS